MCGSTDLVKQDGVYVCQACGTKYSVEEAKRMMIEGTVDVQGTVKVDNRAFVEKYLANAHRAYDKEDWEEVEKYYNMVEQNAPHNMEAVFFSSFGKAMLSLTDDAFFKREQKFEVLKNSISVINDYFEDTDEDKETVLRKISDAVEKMLAAEFVYNNAQNQPAQASWMYTVRLKESVREAFLTELKQIKAVHSDLDYLDELITKNTKETPAGGCYVATAVYGSYDCPQVWTLRRYRDYTLAETWHGRAFIRAYYAISPTLVKWFGHTNWFKKMWRGKLDRMVASLNADGVEDTSYEDRKW
jgi:hypothetical protein